MIYLQLYLSFLQVGLFSVGGGYAAMPLIRSQGAGLSILGIVVFPNGILGLGSIDWIGTGSFFAAFILLRKYKWNPILTMCLCGAAGLGLHLLAGTVG